MVYVSNQINTSATIVAPAGAEADYRGIAVKFNENGAVVAAGAGEAAIGVGIITNPETTPAGVDVDIQVKEIGLCKAGAAIKAGDALAADAAGKLVPATDGQFVLGTALRAAGAEEFVSLQITKYKN